MKKITVILLSMVTIIFFSSLVYYGMRHSRGTPVPVKKQELIVLNAPFINRSIDLARGISLNIWDSLPSKEIELEYQLMAIPWGKSLVSPIYVKAFHNKKDIYFYIEWKDDTQDDSLDSGTFSDASAVMFPMDDDVQPSTLMMGFLGGANIWHWKASQDREFWLNERLEKKVYVDFHYPFEEEELFPTSKDVPSSAVNDLAAIRVGTITKKEIQRVHGRGMRRENMWYVVFKRSLRARDLESDAVFKLNGKKKLCAFAVWNGATKDRGGRKSISDWVELYLRL